MYITSPSPFSARARCKYCSSIPKYYKIAWDRWLLDNFYRDAAAQLKRNMSGLGTAYRNLRKAYDKYSKISAQSFNGTHTQVATLYYKHDIREDDEDFLIDLMICECGKTSWKYKVSERIHVKHRRMRYDLPNQFPIK